MILKSCLMILSFFFNELSRRSKNFERDTYKGGRGALAPRPPLQVFSLTNCSDWCLSLVFLPFNPFWLAEANHKITFCGPWTYLNIHLDSLVWHPALIFLLFSSARLQLRAGVFGPLVSARQRNEKLPCVKEDVLRMF